MKPPTRRIADCLVAALFVLAVPAQMARADDSVCTVLDPSPLQVTVPIADAEPTPIIVDLQGGAGTDVGTVQEVTLPDAPDAAGTAVSDGSALVIRTVSTSDAVSDTTGVAAPVEATATVTLAPTASSGIDSSGSPCSLNPVSDVTDAVDPSAVGATDLGKSGNPLLAATAPIFPVQTLSSALFAFPAGGTFFGLALQNPDAADSSVSIEVWDEGVIVAFASFALPSRTKVTRDVSELFPGMAFGAGTVFHVTATVPVQVLGLSGNEADGSVSPVVPALASP